MFDAFPYDEWSEKIAEYWTFGGAGSTGTYVMLALGAILMIASLIGFVSQETRRLDEQATRLRARGLANTMHHPTPTDE